MAPNTQEELPHRGRQNRRHTYKPRSNYQRRPKPAPTRVRGDPYQSVTALQLGLHPRLIEELHEERRSHVNMLQQLDHRALELFSLVPTLDEVILRAPTKSTWQRAKKQRGWLKQRIFETIEQEKHTLGRLSELHVEIQCRERWTQVERDRQVLGLGQQQRQERYVGCNASLMPLYQPVQATHVNLWPPWLFEKYGLSDHTGGLPSWYPVYEYYGTKNPGPQYHGPQYHETQCHGSQYYEFNPVELDGTPAVGHLPDRTVSYSSPDSPKDSVPVLRKHSSMPSLKRTLGHEEENDGNSA
ncbi:hypothetical protein GGS26DRAFT_464815 [Hypomontagnella submonticulosa]|nr:hypothetical protein GGS26DRAFT_464815 [Hypomontagnella submonticulosa]